MTDKKFFLARRDRPEVRAIPRRAPTPPAALAPEASLRAAMLPDLAGLEPQAGPANDPLSDFTQGPPPLLSVEPKGGEPVHPTAFYSDLIADCLEVMAHLARRRFEGPLSQCADTERRILARADALLAAGGGIEEVLAFWQRERDNPFAAWASVFALAGIEGPEAARALVRGLGALAPDATAAAIFAVEALVLFTRSDLADIERELSDAGSPLLAAMALDSRGRRGALDDAALEEALASPHPSVVEIALRALERTNANPAASTARVTSLLDHSNRSVVWRAARLLTLRGDAAPCAEVREKGALAARLGPKAIDLLAMGGRAEDLGAVEPLLASEKITPAILSAIGRLGNPRAWSFLAHFLAEEELCDAAAAALETLFGARVGPRERLQPAAWQRALSTTRFDPAARLRLGEPWRPAAVAAEIRRGALGREALASRLDELRARSRVSSFVDLGAWAPDVDRQLTEVLAAATRDGERLV